jgi:hypothetical protein
MAAPAKDSGNPNSGILESGGNAAVGDGKNAVLRRYEIYKFGGTYNAETHEAVLAIGSTDSNPLAIDIGNYIGDQNAAVNLNLLPAPVPVPSAVWLLGSALGGLGVLRRHRTYNSIDCSPIE